MKKTSPKIVVLVSGSGSNLQAIIDSIGAGELKAEIAAVVSNKKAAFGLERAKNADIPAVYFPYKPFKEQGREAYDQALAKKVASFEPDLIVLAGWMRIFTPAFLNQFPNQVINLHPALPGTYIGANGVDWAWDSFKAGKISKTGCMVHVATIDLDEGPVIATADIELFAEDTKEDFVKRLRAAEHKLIVQGVSKALETNLQK
ncbi:MAG: phosphoribosylglycinamide formyltransferase [Anaerolineae bacterium]